jgi:hypothetical protein
LARPETPGFWRRESGDFRAISEGITGNGGVEGSLGLAQAE